MDVVNRFPKLRSIDLGGRRLVTDASVSALGAGCGQLQRIDLYGCYLVIHLSGNCSGTDAGVSALGAGCG